VDVVGHPSLVATLHIARSMIVSCLLLGACAAQTSSPVLPRPGFFRIQLGDGEIVALNDGVVSYPATRVLPSATPEAIAHGLSANALTDLEEIAKAEATEHSRRMILPPAQASEN
jgi:hypothetical protein